MGTKLFVGNLSWTATEDDVRNAFAEFGEIVEVAIPRDERDRSRGFAFVTYSTSESAEAAIAALDGQNFMGRPCSVSVAKERPPRQDGGFRRDDRNSGGGGNYRRDNNRRDDFSSRFDRSNAHPSSEPARDSSGMDDAMPASADTEEIA